MGVLPCTGVLLGLGLADAATITAEKAKVYREGNGGQGEPNH